MKNTFISPFLLASLLGLAACVAFSGASYADETTESGGDPAENEAVEKEETSPVGLSGVELDELESDFEPDVKRIVIPPYYQEARGPLKLRVLFPFFYSRERTGEDARSDFGILPFYWRHRSKDTKADVYFPFYWRFRGLDYKTDIVLQTYYNRSEHGYNFGVLPFVMLGKDTRDDSNYQLVPPLFWRFKSGDSSFMLAGIYYQKQDGADYALGLPPLMFAGRERYKTYKVVLPPLFWRFTDELAYETKTVVPPFFFNTREHGYSFGMMPFLYIARDTNWNRTMILPFFYGSEWPYKTPKGDYIGQGKSYYFPLLLSYYRKAPGLSQGGFAFLYQWYWKDGEFMNMYSPLVWTYGNERTDDKRLLIPPLYYNRTSPVQDDQMLGMIYWNFHKHHRERTFAIAPLFAHSWKLYETNWRTWIFPTFDIGKHPEGYHGRLHPIFYVGRDGTEKHFVFAPIVWKFKGKEKDNLAVFPAYWRFTDLRYNATTRVVFPVWWHYKSERKNRENRIAFPFYFDLNNRRDGKRTTLLMPLFWRNKNRRSTMTGFMNFVYHKGEVKGSPFWTFRIAPLLGFGKPPSPEGAYWSFLSGFLAWRRQGQTKELRVFWIPFNLSRRE